MFFKENVELLVVTTSEIFDGDFSFLGINGQNFFTVQDGDDLVGCVGIWFEISRHVGNRHLFESPRLVSVLMHLPLHHWILRLDFALIESNGELACMSFDQVSFVGKRPFLTSHNVEKSTVALIFVCNYYS